MVNFLGDQVPVEIVIGVLCVLTICLLALKLKFLLFLTILSLLLPSLQVPYSNIGRILRWAFLAGLVGKGLFSHLRLGLRPREVTGAHRAILALSALIVASAAYSFGRQVTLAQGAMMMLLWAGVFLVLWNSWREEGDILVLADTLFYLACLIFVLEFAYATLGLGKEIAHGRYAGAFKNPNGLGTAVAFLGPFVYWKHWSTKRQWVRTFCKLLGVVMVIALYQSGSRSGALGAIACMGVMVTWVHRARAAFVVAVAGVPMLLLIVLGPHLDPSVIEESHVVRADSLPHLSDRLPGWQVGFGIFKEKPFFGHGYAMSKFAEVGRANFEIARSLNRTGVQNYHNTHLQLAIDLGVVGVAVFWYFLFFVLRRGVALYGWPRRESMELAGIAFLSAFLALTGDSFVHGWGFSPGSSMGIVFWICAAAVIRCQMLAREKAIQEAEEAAQEQLTYPVALPAGSP